TLRAIKSVSALKHLCHNSLLGAAFLAKTRMAKAIEATGVVTVVGQTTVPIAIRRALGIEFGGQVVFSVDESGQVRVSAAAPSTGDPLLGAFLKLIDKDIGAGLNVRDLPAGLSAALREAAGAVETASGYRIAFHGAVISQLEVLL